uniref:hypothetical protein n=1 Tax=Anaerococcus mediterraneensis TaxID=1870984 RepID=UPI00093044B0|nr:hypothetical protein [Anaerococcus mediterraneensis]
MEVYTKKFHKNNIYIKISDPEKISPGDFEEVSKKYLKPIQIGIYSDRSHLVDLLKKSGFIKKRSTYECKVSASDLKKPLEDPSINLEIVEIGSEFYNKSARLLYDYYKMTHESVNPLAVGFDEFCQVLPKNALFYKKESEIIFAAFIEENEIAYLSGFYEKEAYVFLNDLLTYMFDSFDEIFFEADNTDPLAVLMLDFFNLDLSNSFDAYIKYPKTKKAYILLSADFDIGLYEVDKNIEEDLEKIEIDFLESLRKNTYDQSDFAKFIENKYGQDSIRFIKNVGTYGSDKIIIEDPIYLEILKYINF